MVTGWCVLGIEASVDEPGDGFSRKLDVGGRGCWRNPIARLQDGAAHHDLNAREVEGPGKATWWARATAVWPGYDDYQAATDRTIPLFVLEPGT